MGSAPPWRLCVPGGKGSCAVVLAGGSVGLKEEERESCFFCIFCIPGIGVFSRGFPGNSLTQGGLLAWHTAVMQHFRCDQSACVEHMCCAATVSLGSGLAFMVV